MAFKINTQPYINHYPQVTPSAPVSKPNVETPIKTTIKTGNATTTPQVKYPSHNLLSKYNSAGSYYNSQSALNHQLGITNNTNSNDDEGKQALIQNLQQQSNALNYGISNHSDSALGWSDALGQYLSLDDIALQKKLQEQQTEQAQSDFLNELLWNLKKNLTL